MTILLHEARDMLAESIGEEAAANQPELAYADDTLLLGSTGPDVERNMHYVEAAGGEYGLSFNWSKLEQLPVRTAERVRKSDGTEISTKQSIKYLGGLLSANGRIGSELSRRLGLVGADFRALSHMWRHSRGTG